MKKWLIALAVVFCLNTPVNAAAMSSTIQSIDRQPYTQNIADDRSNRQDVLCLALNIYHEARGSTRQDQVGVAWVTKNRVRSSGRSYCRIIWEPGQYTWTTRSTSSLMPREMAAWHRVVRVSQDVIDGQIADPTNGANTFYSTRIGTPSWARRGTGRIVIGAHVYVRIPGR